MRLEKATKHDISGSLVESIIEEFMESGEKYSEVVYEDEDFTNSGAASAAFKRMARKKGLPVVVTRRAERVFLTNTEVEE